MVACKTVDRRFFFFFAIVNFRIIAIWSFVGISQFICLIDHMVSSISLLKINRVIVQSMT